jgi:hypothetical protein
LLLTLLEVGELLGVEDFRVEVLLFWEGGGVGVLGIFTVCPIELLEGLERELLGRVMRLFQGVRLFLFLVGEV